MGYLRLFLALVIMQAHATPPGLHYAWSNLAVLFFFALSGYGCTAAMQKQYFQKPWTFLVNRYLRLWPSYVVCFGFSCWLMLWIAIPGASIPNGSDWILNLFMMRSDAVPATWVLPYMLLGYVVIALGAGATATRSAMWLVFSFAWAQHRAFVLDWGEYYGSLASWSLAYSVGASVYWLRFKMPRDEGLAKIAGEIAFPIFLVHEPILAVMPLVPGWPLFWASLPPTLALSWALVVFVERPVSKFRKP